MSTKIMDALYKTKTTRNATGATIKCDTWKKWPSEWRMTEGLRMSAEVLLKHAN